jgi:flagellar FliL protein
MAEPEESAPPPAANRSRRKLVVLGAAAGLLLLGGGAAAAYLSGLLGGGQAPEDGQAAPDAPRPKAQALYIPIDPPFTVNLTAGDSTRYLQTTIELLTRDPAVEGAVKQHLPVVRDNLVMLLSSRDARDLATPEGREQLRGDALKAIQDVLRAETGLSGVEQIFFTSFVMQ